MRTLGWTLGLLLLSTTQVSANGAWGGGDLLRRRFVDGRDYAVQVLNKVDAQSLIAARSAVRSWVDSNRSALIADIAASPHSWSSNNGSATCARTKFAPAAAIELSFSTCYRASSTDDAAWLLIHESLHHLGVVDENFSDEITSAVMKAWKEATFKELPICKDQDNVVANRLIGKWETWPELTKQMYPEAWLKVKDSQFSFIEDPSAAKRFSGMGQCAFLAGYMEWRSPGSEGTEMVVRTSPFVLIERNGTTVLLFDEDFGSNPKGIDYHPSYVQLARAQDKAKDLLFFGGDHGWDPHLPLRRIQ